MASICLVIRTYASVRTSCPHVFAICSPRDSHVMSHDHAASEYSLLIPQYKTQPQEKPLAKSMYYLKVMCCAHVLSLCEVGVACTAFTNFGHSTLLLQLAAQLTLAVSCLCLVVHLNRRLHRRPWLALWLHYLSKSEVDAWLRDPQHFGNTVSPVLLGAALHDQYIPRSKIANPFVRMVSVSP